MLCAVTPEKRRQDYVQGNAGLSKAAQQDLLAGTVSVGMSALDRPPQLVNRHGFFTHEKERLDRTLQMIKLHLVHFSKSFVDAAKAEERVLYVLLVPA